MQVDELESSLKEVNAAFATLDEQMSHVSQTAAKVGNRLQVSAPPPLCCSWRYLQVVALVPLVLLRLGNRVLSSLSFYAVAGFNRATVFLPLKLHASQEAWFAALGNS